MLIKAVFIVFISLLAGCVQEDFNTLDLQKVNSYYEPYNGKKYEIVVGSVKNQSNYLNGVFSGSTDKLGKQGKAILTNHLQQTHRFELMDRELTAEASQEAAILNKEQNISGAHYIVSAKIVDFGRKEIGDKQLFGIIGYGKTQVAYAKVNLQIIDTHTSKIIYTTEGAGEYQLSNREVLGFGANASYDSTLNSKVLDLAVREATNNLVNSIKDNSLNL